MSATVGALTVRHRGSAAAGKMTSMRRCAGITVAVAMTVALVELRAIDLDVTPQDIERALRIARAQERERTLFHAPYIQTLDLASVERVEIISEFRRVVLIAEDRVLKGDRAFTYSITEAQRAIAPWSRRLAVGARLRFHPHNVYVRVPPASIAVEGDADLIGVRNEPIYGWQGGQPGDRQPILGAAVEAVFAAASLGQGRRTFVIRLEGADVARVEFDLGSID